MKSFAIGVFLGALFGVSVTAFAASLAGEDGRLSGWAVRQSGEIVCEAPYVRMIKKELWCD